MAKLSANGNHKVGQVTCYRGHGRYVFALRSDGKVLSRNAGFYNDNGDYTAHATAFSIFGKIKPREGSTSYDMQDVERVADILSRKGYRIQETK